MKKDSSVKKLTFAVSMLELCLQLTIFIALAVAAHMGLLRKSSDAIIPCIVVAVGVIVGFLARKFVNRFFIFMLIHALLIAAAALGGGDGAGIGINVCVMIIFSAYSINLKNQAIDRSDFISTPTWGIVEEEEQKEAALRSMVAGERVHMGFLAVMFVGYLVGSVNESLITMNIEMALGVIFILLQIASRNFQRLFEVFSLNIRKNDFPAKQMWSVNKFVNVTVIILVFIGMAVFYNGEYGNLFSILGSFFSAIVKYLVRALIFLLGIFGKEGGTSQVVTQTYTEATEETVILEEPQGSQVLDALFYAVGFVLILAAVLAMLYMIKRYVSNFNKSRKQGMDYIEFIKDNGEEVETQRDESIKRKRTTREERNVRKLYKKRVLKGARGKELDLASTPSELTRDNITRDDEIADTITYIYEKARYSDEKITDDEIKIMKNMS